MLYYYYYYNDTLGNFKVNKIHTIRGNMKHNHYFKGCQGAQDSNNLYQSYNYVTLLGSELIINLIVET